MNKKHFVFLILIFLFPLESSLYSQNTGSTDSLKSLLDKTVSDDARCHLFNEIAVSYSLSNYDSALKYAGLSLELARAKGIRDEEATALNTIGGMYFYQGKYKESMECYIETAKIWDKTGKTDEIGGAYNNIGNICYFQGNFDKSIEYYEKSAEIYKKTNNKRGIAQALYNIANIYQDQKENFDKAERYMKQSLALFKEAKTLKGIAYTLNGLGAIADMTEKYPESVKYYEQALEVFHQIEDRKGEAACLAAIGTIYQKQGANDKAIENLKQGLRIASDIGAMDMMMQIYQALADIHYQTGDYKSSVDYFKSFNLIKDSLTSEENLRQSTEMEARFNSELKQEQIEKQKLELAKSSAEINEQTTLKYAFIIGFGLMLVISLIVFFNYRNKRKINILLTNQKRIIEEVNAALQIRNTEITSQRDEIEKNLRYTEKLQEALKHDLSHYMQLSLRKIINPHFIFNSLNSIQSFILRNDKLEASMYLSTFADLMRKILDQSQKEYISLKEEIEILNLYIGLEAKRFEGKFTWKVIVDPALRPEKIWVPPLVSQPFIENAIWHGLMPLDKEGKLIVLIKATENNLVVSIEDNGIGREQSAILNHNRENRTSHGIKITKERIQIINSLDNNENTLVYHDLKDDQGQAAGTRVEYLLPLNEMISDD